METKHYFEVSLNGDLIEGSIKADSYKEAVKRLSTPDFLKDDDFVILRKSKSPVPTGGYEVEEVFPSLKDIADYFEGFDKGDYPHFLCRFEDYEGRPSLVFEAWGSELYEVPICRIMVTSDGDLYISEYNSSVGGSYMERGVEEYEDIEHFYSIILEKIRLGFANSWSAALDRIEFIDEWRKAYGFGKDVSEPLRVCDNSYREI